MTEDTPGASRPTPSLGACGVNRISTSPLIGMGLSVLRRDSGPHSDNAVSRDLADLLGLFGTARAREDAGPSLSHPIYFERPDAVDLDDVALRYGKVMHALGHDKVGARWHIFAGFFVKLVTSSDAEDP
jgi:hypothetical protein